MPEHSGNWKHWRYQKQKSTASQYDNASVQAGSQVHMHRWSYKPKIEHCHTYRHQDSPTTRYLYPPTTPVLVTTLFMHHLRGAILRNSESTPSVSESVFLWLPTRQKINTEVNERVLKNLGAHWNIRHHWFQLVPISCSLAHNVPLWVLCGPV